MAITLYYETAVNSGNGHQAKNTFCGVEPLIIDTIPLSHSSLKFKSAEQWCSLGMRFLKYLNQQKLIYEEQVMYHFNQIHAYFSLFYRCLRYTQRYFRKCSQATALCDNT